MYFYQLEKIKFTIKVAMETQKPRKKYSVTAVIPRQNIIEYV